MELYFLRHGDAEPASAAGSDAERRLTDRGKRETRTVALAMQRAGARPEMILTSPLVRARETAAVLESVFGGSAEADERLASGCSLGDIQRAVSTHDRSRLVFVGHEPDLSRIVGQLVGSARVSMSKSGVARVDCGRAEPDAGILVWLLSPQILRAD